MKEAGDGNAHTLCHYSCLALEFTDAWAEGGGPRILRCWCLFLPHFSAVSRTKYDTISYSQFINNMVEWGTTSLVTSTMNT